MKETIFTAVQAILAVILIVSILLQQKGGGISGVFGGSSNIYSTKRGVDKILHYTTVVVSVLFFGVGIARLIF